MFVGADLVAGRRRAELEPGVVQPGPGEPPGEVAQEVWIKVTAEEGTWGVGRLPSGPTGRSYTSPARSP